jgi:hypothetical protein
MAIKIKAVINPLTRQPIIQQRGTGKNAANVPRANVSAIRNPLARQR